jgi:hypothetical protein
MGRDAGGHGHDAGEQGNPSHGKGGLFDSGGGDSGSSGGGHTSAGARAAFAERAKLRANPPKGKPEAKVKADHATKAAAAKGDHQRAQSHDGRGYPVSSHAGRASVGTHKARGSGGGGGGGSSGGGSSGGGSRGALSAAKHKGLTQNAKERVAIGKATDQRHQIGASEPAAQTIQFGRGENVPASRKSYGRGPSGRRRG